MNIKVETPIETTEQTWRSNEYYRKELMNHKKWGQFFTKISHDISQDKDDGAGNGAIVETDFWKQLIPARTVDIIGEELANTINVTEETTKYPIMTEADLGKTVPQGRGLTSGLGRAGRLRYQYLKLGKSYNTYDRVDQDFLEDVQMGVLKYYWQELHRAHDQYINQLYVDQIQNIESAAPASGKLRPTATFEDDSGNTHTKVPLLTLGNVGGLDLMRQAYTHCRQMNFTPDCILMNLPSETELVLDEDFKDSDYYQFTGTPTGKMMQSIMGCRIFSSNMVRANASGKKIEFWMWDKKRVLMCAMRRNRMVKKIENHETMEEGLAISTRLGFGLIDTGSIIHVQSTSAN